MKKNLFLFIVLIFLFVSLLCGCIENEGNVDFKIVDVDIEESIEYEEPDETDTIVYHATYDVNINVKNNGNTEGLCTIRCFLTFNNKNDVNSAVDQRMENVNLKSSQDISRIYSLDFTSYVDSALEKFNVIIEVYDGSNLNDRYEKNFWV